MKNSVVNIFGQNLVFDIPKRLVFPFSWTGHIPFAFFLIQQLQPRLLVELGVHSGNSYNAFCQTVKTLKTQTACYGVDTWQGDEHAGFYPETIYSELLAYQQREYPEFSQLMRMTFDEALEYFADHTVDLLHIDGCHRYSDVRHDFESWLPKVSERGVVLFHDTQVRRDDFGVWRLWKEFSEHYPSFEFRHSYGLGVLAVGTEVEATFLDLLQEFSTTPYYQNLFASLGNAITLSAENMALTDTLRQKDEALVQLSPCYAAQLFIDTGIGFNETQALTLPVQGVERKIDFDLSEYHYVRRLRFDPLTDFTTLHIHSIQLVTMDGGMVPVESYRTNACFQDGNTLLFNTPDPQIVFESPVEEAQKLVVSLEYIASGSAATFPYILRQKDAELSQKDAELSQKDAELSQKDAELSQKDAELNQKDAELNQKDAELSQKDAELSQKDADLGQKIQLIQQMENTLSWEITRPLRRIRHYKLFQRQWSYQDRSWKGKALRLCAKTFWPKRVIVQSGLFDPDYYLKNNPDVAQAGLDPLRHFVRYGGKEGRCPHPGFDSAYYLEQNQDVAASGCNPLVHYLLYGSNEGRSATVSVSEEESLKESPQVSIVIPVFNAISMTKACLQSLYEECDEIPFEVLVIDNASTDETPIWLKREKEKRLNLDVITMEENVGFGPAVNIGIRSSHGSSIVILNNDTLVAPGWLKNLVAAISIDPTIGIVSPVTNYVGEGPQLDENATHLSNDPRKIAHYAKTLENCSQLIYEPNRLVFFCVLIRRELVDMIGELDTGYEKGNFEDDDYCLRARMAGYRLAIAPNAFVYHHGSVTFKSNQISHSQHMERNRRRFYQKAGRISTSVRQCHLASCPVTASPEITVIVRTKDRPLLFQRTITSLANQTFRDFEIVVVNDGGEDVVEHLNAFGAQLLVNYVHHKVSKGRTAAINAGIQQSRGKWITYLDDDDIVYPWHLESLFLAAQNSGHKLVYSDYNRALFSSSENSCPDVITGAPSWQYSRRELLVQNHIPIHTWMHARECVEAVGLWEDKLERLEDYEFLLRVSAAYDFYPVNKVTCEYRYYLDIANSISIDRHKYLDSLQHIYAKHAVHDADLLEKREEILELLTMQVEKIERLKTQANETMTESAVNREIFRIVVGL